MLEQVGINRDLSRCEHAVIVYASTSVHPAVIEANTLQLRITGNGAASAAVNVDLYYALGY